MRKVLMIGLDGCNPDLVYDWQEELPNIRGLMERGLHGRIASTVPPITPQAWTAVLTGKNPGKFGFWDFSYRDDFSYGEPKLVNSRKSRSLTDTLDTILPKYDKKIALINVPVTYPPVEIPNGYCISSFMTPSVEHAYTYPAELRNEVEDLVGEYLLDASTSETNFRKMDRDQVLERIFKMDQQRFDLTHHFMGKGCDLIFTVIMGTDRMPHLFWRFMDSAHFRHVADSKFKNAIKEHYKYCDSEIGRLIEAADKETVVMVLSDHSVQRLDGRININDWLIEQGYLKLKTKPEAPVPLKKADIDWENTTAYGTGYTGQIYLNLKGREAQGIVDEEDYDRVLDELAEKIVAIRDEKGNALQSDVVRRKDIYNGPYAQYAPDLFMEIDNFNWNVSEAIGHDSIYSYDTALGEDDGGHGPYGIFAMAGAGVPKRGQVEDIRLLDVAPTVLKLFGLNVPADMDGKSLISDEGVYSEEDEEEIRKRLSALGYLA